MRVIGIDEAGFGPLLGPLVVAAVSLECDRYHPDAIWSALAPGWVIADSKTVLSHRHMASGEETTLSLLALSGRTGERVGDLLEGLLVPPPDLRRGIGASETPSGSPPLAGAFCAVPERSRPAVCGELAARLPRWGEAPSPERADDLRRCLARAGVRLAAARAVAICPGVLNDAMSAGVSKLLVDWRLFAELLRQDLDELSPGGYAACGKLGGRSAYGALLADLGLSSVIEEGRALSAYHLTGLGRVEFIRHAESAHPPVAMASMIAKLVREYVLDGWHAALAREVPGLESCSGYRDPVTASYVKRTEAARSRLGISQRCFLRLK